MLQLYPRAEGRGRVALQTAVSSVFIFCVDTVVVVGDDVPPMRPDTSAAMCLPLEPHACPRFRARTVV